MGKGSQGSLRALFQHIWEREGGREEQARTHGLGEAAEARGKGRLCSHRHPARCAPRPQGSARDGSQEQRTPPGTVIATERRFKQFGEETNNVVHYL